MSPFYLNTMYILLSYDEPWSASIICQNTVAWYLAKMTVWNGAHYITVIYVTVQSRNICWFDDFGLHVTVFEPHCISFSTVRIALYWICIVMNFSKKYCKCCWACYSNLFHKICHLILNLCISYGCGITCVLFGRFVYTQYRYDNIAVSAVKYRKKYLIARYFVVWQNSSVCSLLSYVTLRFNEFLICNTAILMPRVNIHHHYTYDKSHCHIRYRMTFVCCVEVKWRCVWCCCDTTVPGSAVAMRVSADTSFKSLEGAVSESTMKAVADMNFSHMTEIQAKTIPPLLEGR